ncbi:MAG TPA: hypothetical protein VGH28_09340 [Polyangiaceae bacterium]
MLVVSLLALPAFGAEEPSETKKLFDDGVHALQQERPNEAIASFEALADRGVVDATASYDRGLAYALRVHMNAEQPGDLGRAAHGFEEARELSNDSRLASDAESALASIRSEVARRKAREGVTVDMEQRASPWRTLSQLLGENAWAAVAVGFSILLGAGLFARWLAEASRARAGAAIAIAVSAPMLVVAAALARTARHDRLYLREAVVVSPSVRPSDSHGIALPQAPVLPEAARVEVVDQNGGWTEVRWGGLHGWVPAATLRTIDKP